MVRNLTFGVVALGLIAGYAWLAAQLAPAVGPAVSEPTPTPTRPAEQTGAPRVPGSIAFGIRGDLYVLRDGRYAPVTSEGRNSQPHLTADGTTIYFARQETVDGRSIVDQQVVNARLSYTAIIRKPVSGGREEVVLDGLRRRSADGFHAVSWFLGPSVSPDGRRLAVMEDDGDGAADLEVWTLPTTATGRPSGSVLSQGADLEDTAWSPDGRRIAVTSYNSDVPGILVWDASRIGAATRLDLPDGEAYRPSWSPDGEWILYTLRDGSRNDLHAFELDTERDIALTTDGKSWNGVFSPDGSHVAFLRERNGTIDVYAMEIANALTGGAPKEAVKLTRGEGIDGQSRPSWSR